MNEQTTHNLIEALKPWMSEAIVHIWPHRDVRVVFYARENVITVEAAVRRGDGRRGLQASPRPG